MTASWPVGADRDYLDTLLAKGDLGSAAGVPATWCPRADRATGMLYVNFDANGWAEQAGGAAQRRRPAGAGERRTAGGPRTEQLAGRGPGPARPAPPDRRLSPAGRRGCRCLWTSWGQRYAQATNCVSRNELPHAQQEVRAVPGRHARPRPATRCCRPRAIEDKVLEHLAARPDRDRDGLARPRASRRPSTLTERLARHGYDVVPHLAARMVSGRSELAEIVRPARAAGRQHASSCPAGDADPPAGDYTCALRPARGPHRAGPARSPRSASPATPSRTRRSATT